jgi:hypothetical protein
VAKSERATGVGGSDWRHRIGQKDYPIIMSHSYEYCPLKLHSSDEPDLHPHEDETHAQ